MELIKEYVREDEFRQAQDKLISRGIRASWGTVKGHMQWRIQVSLPLKGRARFLRRHKATLSVLGFLKPDVVEAIQ